MSGVVPQDIFESEESVLKALSVIRNSILSIEEKSHLRDLFLDYAGEVGENRRESLREDILNKLRPHAAALPTLAIPKENISREDSMVSSNEKSGEPASKSSLGRQRPIPAFKTVTVAVVHEPIIPLATTATEPVQSQPATEEYKVAETSNLIISEPTAAPVDLRARIDTIKHDINGKVGNPVNLINADEKIGREYMSALLDAMKSVSGGGGETPAATRLENAYQAALSLIEKTPNESVSVSTVASPTPEENLSDTNETEETSEPPALDIEPEPVIDSTQKEEPPVIESYSKPINSQGLYHQPIDDTDSVLESEELAIKNAELTDRVTKNDPEKSTERRVKIGIPKVMMPQTKKAEPLHSLKDEVALPEQMAKVKAEAVKREEASHKPITDLNSPEVQKGLEQLLSEWRLFKSSGFLGSGPRGINHPLYKQLSSLPMAAVVAGRFEGVTPDIKQSITDYMNGWRYEQGIVHEMGETFENYLRRVIKQILTRQRVSISS